MNRSIFFDDWQACLRAHYIHVIRTGDRVTEPTLRHVLLHTGLNEADLAALVEEARGMGALSPDAEFDASQWSDAYSVEAAATILEAGEAELADEADDDAEAAAYYDDAPYLDEGALYEDAPYDEAPYPEAAFDADEDDEPTGAAEPPPDDEPPSEPPTLQLSLF